MVKPTEYTRNINLQLLKDYNSLNAYVPGTLPKSPPGIVPCPGGKLTEDTSNGNMGDNQSNILVDSPGSSTQIQYPRVIAGKGKAQCVRQSNRERCWAAALSCLLRSTFEKDSFNLNGRYDDLTEGGIINKVRAEENVLGRKLLGAADGSLPDTLRNAEIPYVLTHIFNLESPMHLEGNIWPLMESKLKSDHLVIIMFSKSDWYNPGKATGPCAGLPCWHWWVAMGVKEVDPGIKQAYIMDPDPKKGPCIRWEFLDTIGATQPWLFTLAWCKIGKNSYAEKNQWIL